MNAPDKALEIRAAVTAVIAFGTALFGWVGWVIIIWLCAMVLDYITGSLAALSRGEWRSRLAREGLWHKLGSIAAVLVAALCDIAAPDVGVVTNIGTAHLEFFRTQDGIAAEKGVLGASAREFFVIGDNNVRRDALKKMCRGEAVVADTGLDWMREALSGILPGEHNVSNACIAFAVAARFGVTREQTIAALEGFALPGARWRRTEKWGATFIDDTYNANPSSMIAALDSFAATPCDGKRIAVLGDMFELGENALELHRQVFDHAMKLGIPLVIGVGEMSSQCLCHLVYKDLGALKKKFRVDVSAGDLVLLKASHSMKLGELLV